MMRLAVSAAVLLALGCGSAPGEPPATTPPADAHVAEIQTAMTELLERLDVMNERIARLEQAQESIGATADLGRRPAAEPAAAPQTPPPQRAVIGAQLADQYRTAIVLYGKNRAAEARAVFQQVYDADPTGDLADNALYWIAETYYGAGDYGRAMSYYRRVAENYAEQNKAPDALFKLGLAQAKTGDLVLARKTLEEVISRYPYSSPAASAKAELQRIKY